MKNLKNLLSKYDIMVTLLKEEPLCCKAERIAYWQKHQLALKKGQVNKRPGSQVMMIQKLAISGDAKAISDSVIAGN
jgi:hypothetical protein